MKEFDLISYLKKSTKASGVSLKAKPSALVADLIRSPNLGSQT